MMTVPTMFRTYVQMVQKHHMAIFGYYWVAQVVPMLIILAIKILDKLKAGSLSCTNVKIHDGAPILFLMTLFSVVNM